MARRLAMHATRHDITANQFVLLRIDSPKKRSPEHEIERHYK